MQPHHVTSGRRAAAPAAPAPFASPGMTFRHLGLTQLRLTARKKPPHKRLPPPPFSFLHHPRKEQKLPGGGRETELEPPADDPTRLLLPGAAPLSLPAVMAPVFFSSLCASGQIPRPFSPPPHTALPKRRRLALLQDDVSICQSGRASSGRPYKTIGCRSSGYLPSPLGPRPLTEGCSPRFAAEKRPGRKKKKEAGRAGRKLKTPHAPPTHKTLVSRRHFVLRKTPPPLPDK